MSQATHFNYRIKILQSNKQYMWISERDCPTQLSSIWCLGITAAMLIFILGISCLVAGGVILSNKLVLQSKSH